jgi:hypothetical protein
MKGDCEGCREQVQVDSKGLRRERVEWKEGVIIRVRIDRLASWYRRKDERKRVGGNGRLSGWMKGEGNVGA